MKDEVKKEVKKESNVEARLCAVERIVDRLKVWLETIHGADIDGDGHIGKAGRSTIGSMLITAMVAVSTMFAFADNDVANWADQVTHSGSTAKVFYDDSQSDYSATFCGYVNATDGFNGDVNTDDINATGASTESLDINIPHTTATTVGTITYKVAQAISSLVDGNKMVVVGLNGYHSSSEAGGTVNYVTHDYIMSDVTSDSEDGSYVIKIMKAGTDTAVMTVDANGVKVNSGESIIGSKFATVGQDDSTPQMVLGGSKTGDAGTTDTNNFATTFGGIPYVVCTYTEDAGDVAPISIMSVGTANFICSVTASKNYNWIAIGSRP